MLNRLLF